jgi:hypothetical protein
MTITPTIVGAGLAGLIAAHAWPTATVLEAGPGPRQAHRALLRFRTDAVARLTGIEFRRVTVRKGLWAAGEFCAPNIRHANTYAQKVLGPDRLLGDRSVWNLDTVERFIAPETLYEQMIEAVGPRIHWNTPADFAGMRGAVVSTAPLPATLAALGMKPECDFPRAPITVSRWVVPGADVFQTVYFPEPHLSVYRASITGSTLIVESVGPLELEDIGAVEHAFGVRKDCWVNKEQVQQSFGKIAPIDDALRKQLLFRLTHEHNVFSLGRFATWRNILLDDVVDDIVQVKRLLKSSSAYDLRRAAA